MHKPSEPQTRQTHVRERQVVGNWHSIDKELAAFLDFAARGGSPRTLRASTRFFRRPSEIAETRFWAGSIPIQLESYEKCRIRPRGIQYGNIVVLLSQPIWLPWLPSHDREGMRPMHWTNTTLFWLVSFSSNVFDPNGLISSWG